MPLGKNKRVVKTRMAVVIFVILSSFNFLCKVTLLQNKNYIIKYDIINKKINKRITNNQVG